MTDGRRLGRILLRDDPQAEPPVAKLGFDPLLAMPPPKRFSELIRARGANVKSLLLDQSFAAGVGNWIADEVLYQAGIDPRRRAAVADRRGSAPAAREGSRRSSSAPSTPTPTTRATRARGCSTGAGASAPTRARRGASASST